MFKFWKICSCIFSLPFSYSLNVQILKKFVPPPFFIHKVRSNVIKKFLHDICSMFIVYIFCFTYYIYKFKSDFLSTDITYWRLFPSHLK
jgi:hypothetical protein